MKVTINEMVNERKVVAYLSSKGELIFPNVENIKNTVINRFGEATSGAFNFVDIKNHSQFTPIYEGDEITIKFQEVDYDTN